jgi:drug/metabolite transporter (DMT)-like permease
MIWFLLAMLSAIASASQNIFHRKIMMTENPYAYAFLENIFTGILFIPAAIIAWYLPREPIAWALVLCSSVLWSLIAVIAMHTYKYTKVSLRAPVNESRAFWLLLFSAIILGELITMQKILGVALIFLGLVYLNYKKGSWGSFADRGVQLTFLVAIISALTAVVDKKATAYWTPGVYGALVYIIPSIFIGAYAITQKGKDVKHIIKTKHSWLIAVVILGFIFYFCQLSALKLAEASVVYPVLRMSSLFTVLGGIIFLNERSDILKKIISTIVVIAGVALVSGYW